MAEQSGDVTGAGGVFVKSKDTKALAQWYREVLGLEVKPWGGAALPFDMATLKVCAQPALRVEFSG